MKLRELTESEVEFTLEIEPEDINYRGNCSAIDDDTDRETEQWISDQLDSGNECAWCYAVVIAEWGEYRGRAGIGGCSYESFDAIERDLLTDDIYDLKSEALADLNRQIAESIETADKLRAALTE